jgi:hypothetical protein
MLAERGLNLIDIVWAGHAICRDPYRHIYRTALLIYPAQAGKRSPTNPSTFRFHTVDGDRGLTGTGTGHKNKSVEAPVASSITSDSETAMKESKTKLDYEKQWRVRSVLLVPVGLHGQLPQPRSVYATTPRSSAAIQQPCPSCINQQARKTQRTASAICHMTFTDPALYSVAARRQHHRSTTPRPCHQRHSTTFRPRRRQQHRSTATRRPFRSTCRPARCGRAISPPRWTRWTPSPRARATWP